MAVQAQYPSNVLLLNRSGQDQKKLLGGSVDYSLQLQADDILHSQMLYSNGVTMNPRKRVRETVAAPETHTNLCQLQSQHPVPTIVDLSQLHAQHPAVVSTGLRLAYEEQQQQQQLGLFLPSSILSSSLSEDLAAQIKRQKDEIDQILQSQGDQLRRTLAERRQRHHRLLLAAAEESAARRLREKEAEVEAATRRRAELEERVAQLKAEAQAWQAQARAQEAVAASLQAQLRQAMETLAGKGGEQDKAEELGCAGELPLDDAESAHLDPGRVVTGSPTCRVCRDRGVSVLLLPCRHLCVCNGCDTTLDACPVCNCLRSGSVEVFLS